MDNQTNPAKIYIHEEYVGKRVVSVTEYFSDGSFCVKKIDPVGLKLYKWFKIKDGKIIRVA